MRLSAIGSSAALGLCMLAAACSGSSEVGGTVASPFPFVMSGPSTYARVSGAEATALITDPGNVNMAVERLGWRQIGPNGCMVTFYKRDPNNPAATDKDQSDKCEDRMPQGRWLVAGFDNARSSGSLTFMTAVRGCFDDKTGRLVGYETVLKRYSLEGTSALLTDLPEEDYKANAADCTLAPWSECAAGQVINGVRVHYGRIEGLLNIVGIQARCRRFLGPA